MEEEIPPGYYNLRTKKGTVTLRIREGEVLSGADILANNRLPAEPEAVQNNDGTGLDAFLSQFRTAAESTQEVYTRTWEEHREVYGENAALCVLPPDLDRGFPLITTVINKMYREKVHTVEDLLSLPEAKLKRMRLIGKKSLQFINIWKDIARASLDQKLTEEVHNDEE